MVTGSLKRDTVTIRNVSSRSVGVTLPSKLALNRRRVARSISNITFTRLSATVSPSSGPSASAGKNPWIRYDLSLAEGDLANLASCTCDIIDETPSWGSKKPMGVTCVSILFHVPDSGLVIKLSSPTEIRCILTAKAPNKPRISTERRSGLSTSPDTSSALRLDTNSVLPT